MNPRPTIESGPSPFVAQLLRYACLLLVLPYFSGCSKTEEWREDVALPNGGQVTIERSTAFATGGESRLGFGWVRDRTKLSFKHPTLGPGTIVFWESEDYPILLDVTNDLVRLIAVGSDATRDCKVYNHYQWKEGKWTKAEPFKDLENVRANLALTDNPPADYIKLSAQEAINAEGSIPEIYKRYVGQRGPCLRVVIKLSTFWS